MDSKILEYIIAIAEEKSVSRAADRFYLSQSVLSHHLKGLEEEFGEPFFTREARGMELTRAGIVFVNNARTILHLEEQLEKRMEELRRRQFRSLQVMVDSTNRNYFIRGILAPFREEFPQISLELMEGNFIQAQRILQDGRADLALCVSNRPALEGCQSQILFQDDLVFLLPVGCGKTETAEELRQKMAQGMEVCLHPVGTSMRMIEEMALAREKVFPTVIMESRSFQTSRVMVREGQCGVFYPKSILTQAEETLEQAAVLESTVYFLLAWAGETKRSRAFHRLVENAREAYRDFAAKTMAAPTLKQLQQDSQESPK